MEHDLDTTARAIMVGVKIEKMLGIVEDAKHLRKAFTDEQKEILEACGEIHALDKLSVAIGLAKASQSFLTEFESSLYEIAEMAHQQAVEAISAQKLSLVESFIVAISELKPRSIRHLENFFSATTDGEWVDGLFVSKGKDSEFRCVDRCSDEARAEFGITTNKK